MNIWEMFCDESYYGYWCVRDSRDLRFDSPRSFHFVDRETAERFKELVEQAV